MESSKCSASPAMSRRDEDDDYNFDAWKVFNSAQHLWGARGRLLDALCEATDEGDIRVLYERVQVESWQKILLEDLKDMPTAFFFAQDGSVFVCPPFSDSAIV